MLFIKKTSRSLIILLAVTTIGIDRAAGQEEPRRLTIKAGAVEVSTNPQRITGSFEIEPSSNPNPDHAILSMGRGGACLLADLNEFGIPALPRGPGNAAPRCETDNECKGGLTGEGQGDWWSYCIHKRCWTRPSAQREGCDVSGLHGGAPFPDGEHAIPADGGSLDPGLQGRIPKGKTVRWRVRACLNPPGNNGCAGDGPVPPLTDDGPEKPIRIE